MVDVCANQVAKGAADENVGWEVIPASEPSDGYRKRGAISQHFDPRLWIFVTNHTRHCPHKHGVPGRKRSIDAVALPEAAVSGSVIRAFSSGDELHGSVDEK